MYQHIIGFYKHLINFSMFQISKKYKSESTVNKFASLFQLEHALNVEKNFSYFLKKNFLKQF